MVRGLGISKQDVLDAAVIFGGCHQTFSARDFTGFLAQWGLVGEEDKVNDLLLEFTAHQQLREIGPGVYARPEGVMQNCSLLEHPIFGEDGNE